jgi:aminopeptidase N
MEVQSAILKFHFAPWPRARGVRAADAGQMSTEPKSAPRVGAYDRMAEASGGTESRSLLPVQSCSRSRGYLAIGALAVLIVVGAIVAFVLVNMTVDSCAWNDYRLPHWVSPSSYTVRWKPSMQQGGSLTGTVTMDANVLYPGVGCVVMNSVGFTFTSLLVTVTPKGAPDSFVPQTRVLDASSIRIMEENQQIAIPLGQMLAMNDRITLQLGFAGTMSDTLNGMYLSSSMNPDGSNNTVIVTQFEATYARKAFPCLDEPAFKAEFTVILDGIEPGLAALSNMPPTSITPYGSDGLLTYQFEPSVPMSTYLVAVVVGEFEATWETYVSPLDANRTVNVSVWAPPGNSNRLQFAVGCARKSLAAYESTFGVPFPLPEMKMAAIASFAAGAMENWGLVTYRLTALLADVNEASQSSLERVAVVVAHELAHQWFGNLVTTAYWNQLFLNEGFATLIEYLGTEASNPSFHIWDEFLGGDVHRAMRVDDLAAVSPLVSPNVDSSGAIESQFNDIAYAKGGSVLRMLWKFMDSSPLTRNVRPGNDDGARMLQGSQDDDAPADNVYTDSIFFGGLQEYLNTYKYDVATADQLIAVLADYSQYDQLNTDMATWTHQPGVPLVMFHWQSGTEGATEGNMCISQRRLFRSDYSRQQAATGEFGNDQLYWVPLNFVVEAGQGSPAQSFADAVFAQGGFRNETLGCFPYSVNTDGFLKANNESFGYYRVSYPSAVWSRLADAVINSTKDDQGAVFSPQDRAGLLDDILTVAETSADAEFQMRHLRSAEASSMTSITTALDYMRTLRSEATYPVWRSGITHILRITSLLAPEAEPGDNPPIPPNDPNQCIPLFQGYARYLAFPMITAIGNSWGNLSSAVSEPADLSDPDVASVVRQLMSRTGAQSLDEYRLRADEAVFKAAIISLAAQIGNQAVVNRTIELWNSGLENIDPNYLSIVAASYVRSGGAPEWTEVRNAYVASTEAFSKNILLRALGESTIPSVLQQALEFAMSNNVDPQDTVTLLAGVASNPVGRALAWNYITTPAIWTELVRRYGSGGFTFSELISVMASSFASQLWFDEAQTFFANANLEAGTEEAAQALEIIQSHISFATSQQPDACGWLTTAPQM